MGIPIYRKRREGTGEEMEVALTVPRWVQSVERLLSETRRAHGMTGAARCAPQVTLSRHSPDSSHLRDST